MKRPSLPVVVAVLLPFLMITWLARSTITTSLRNISRASFDLSAAPIKQYIYPLAIRGDARFQSTLASSFPSLSASQPTSVAMAEASTPSQPDSATTKSTTTTTEPVLPPLSAADFRHFNRLAEHMDYFHNHFRHLWNILYTACEQQTRPSGMSIRQFLQTGLQLCSNLDMHHRIEEAHVFPKLAQKMPKFRNVDSLVGQHREIHKGLDELEHYLERCRAGETELQLEKLKVILDGFGKVLWAHLDDEVAELGAENMRKYWNREEIDALDF